MGRSFEPVVMGRMLWATAYCDHAQRFSSLGGPQKVLNKTLSVAGIEPAALRSSSHNEVI